MRCADFLKLRRCYKLPNNCMDFQKRNSCIVCFYKCMGIARKVASCPGLAHMYMFFEWCVQCICSQSLLNNESDSLGVKYVVVNAWMKVTFTLQKCVRPFSGLGNESFEQIWLLITNTHIGFILPSRPVCMRCKRFGHITESSDADLKTLLERCSNYIECTGGKTYLKILERFVWILHYRMHIWAQKASCSLGELKIWKGFRLSCTWNLQAKSKWNEATSNVRFENIGALLAYMRAKIVNK